MKKIVCALALGVLAPWGAAVAQVNTTEGAVDAELFKPAVGEGLFGVDSAQILGNYKLHFGAFLNYASNPLVIFTEQNGEVFLIPVQHQSALDLMVAVGLQDRFEVGLAIPAGLFIAGEDLGLIGGEGSVQSGKLGDVRVNGKVSLLGDVENPDADGLRATFNLEVKLNTGESLTQAGTESFFGDAAPRLAAIFLGNYKTGKITAMANAGIRIRASDTASIIENIAIGNELVFGVGADYAINDKLHGLGEIDGVASIEVVDDGNGGTISSLGSSPTELRLGAKIAAGKFWIPVGVGVGLNNSFSAPDFRIFAGVNFTGQDLDPDKDQILGPLDACPKEPEDYDGFEDTNGCPDNDNDRDLIADKIDQCANEAEDKDEFKDEDGCPDLDNDEDTINDVDDKCKLEKEDKDNFEDTDGCPELDNDQDGIADTDDACPIQKGTAEFQGCADTDADKISDNKDKCVNDAEDFDQFEDADGCPELDNDQDTVADKDDACPLQKGAVDLQGCPDADEDKIADKDDLCINEKEDGKGKNPKDGCPDTTKAVLSGGKVVILDKIFFDTGKTTIKAVSNPVLNGVVKVLKENPQVVKVRIEGNTDDVGDEAKNQTLSEGRAKAVMDYLIKNGVDASRLEFKGNGETVPLAPVTGLDPKKQKKELEAARDQNRRVEFFVVE